MILVRGLKEKNAKGTDVYMTKECIYCGLFFACEKQTTKDYCLNYQARDEESEELHRIWREEKARKDRRE